MNCAILPGTVGKEESMAGKCLGNAMKSLSHRIVHVQKCHFVQIFLESQGAFQ